jgi:hypothetical protein
VDILPDAHVVEVRVDENVDVVACAAKLLEEP